jgi:hypothetical protein
MPSLATLEMSDEKSITCHQPKCGATNQNSTGLKESPLSVAWATIALQVQGLEAAQHETRIAQTMSACRSELLSCPPEHPDLRHEISRAHETTRLGFVQTLFRWRWVGRARFCRGGNKVIEHDTLRLDVQASVDQKTDDVDQCLRNG